MSASVVISQPMLFPWLGMIEQFLLADIFVFYDDVAFSKGSFTNRVQIKSGNETSWLTIPVKKASTSTPINRTLVAEGNWKRKHLNSLSQTYSRAPYCTHMVDLVNRVYRQNHRTISGYAASSMLVLAEYMGIDKTTEIYYSSALGIDGASTQRVFEIVQELGGSNYITGHGAKNYLDHQMFEDHNIQVSYMDYNITPYIQMGESFTPYVSSLDAIAMLGEDTLSVAKSKTINWREFIDG